MAFLPVSARPSTTIPPPTPVPRMTPNTTRAPAAEPSTASEKAKQLASFSRRIGRPNLVGHLIRGKQMVKCSKAEVRRLKTALRWKIPAAQRQRIQMVLLRESGMAQPAIAGGNGRVAEHSEPCAHGL